MKKNGKPHKNGRLSGEPHSINALTRAIDLCGGKRAEFARVLSVSWTQVDLWLSGKSNITGERAVQIEYVTDGRVRRDELRPDLYRKRKGKFNEVGTG